MRFCSGIVGSDAVGGKRQPGKSRKRLRACLSHYRCAVALDRTLAYAEIGREVLAGLTGKHQ